MTRRLTNILLAVAILLLLALLVLVLGTTWFLWHEKTTAESGIRATSALIREATLTAKNLREASDVWKKASQDQSSAITAAAQNVSAAARQLSLSASGLEKSSTALLNASTQAVNEQSAALLQNQQQLQANLVEIQAATVELRQTLKTADQQIGNPAIAETLQHVEESAANLEAGTKDVKQVLDKFRETYLKPVNLFWAGFEKLLGIGPPIVTAIK